MSYERDQLAKRMQELCDELKMPKEKRQTLLAKKYGKTVTTGRNWLLGIKIPDYETVSKMCVDANFCHEYLMTGRGLKFIENTENYLIVTDPDLIKLVNLATPLPEFGRKMAIKGVDSVCQFVAEVKAEYKK